MLIAVAAVLSALFGAGGVGVVLRFRSQNRKDDAEASGFTSEALSAAMNQAQGIYHGTLVDLQNEYRRSHDAHEAELVRLNARVDEAERREQDCLRRLEALETQGRRTEAKVDRVIEEAGDAS